VTKPITTLVHYVRAYRLDDGTNEECPAIVCANYANGAHLHIFEDKTSGRHAAPPDSRTKHDPAAAVDTWHFANECRLGAKTDDAARK
jgi:hypothetical protein